MAAWHLGNTTVRSPFRLRDGLIALATSSLQGNLRGTDNEKTFNQLLSEFGVVALSVNGDETYSIGRKWRSALEKLGFIYPKVTEGETNQEALGKLDTITPNGRRLMNSDTVPAMQECFLRSLAAFYIAIKNPDGTHTRKFSPLRHTLAILLELEKRTGESRLNFIEMALVVLLSNGDEPISHTVDRILNLRSRRLNTPIKRRFDSEEKRKAAAINNYAATTFNDYADTNFRYLKATGLVRTKGKGITLVPEKKVFIEKLIADTEVPDNELSYLRNLTNGASLPTDNRETGLEILDDLIQYIQEKGVNYTLPAVPLETAADVSNVRHQAEDLLSKLNERDFARQQAANWQEIVAYMDLLISGSRSTVLKDSTEIEIPPAEAPAYFEWILWRAFLAMDNLVNEPYNARRFKIDQDFLPVGCAPGGGPDLIFEFTDFVIVGEVTLTDNSRQEAAEGEPVRRHVADLVYRFPDKTVYGLFMAKRIDSNTAETFRIGVWYTNADQKMNLDIIPVTLKQFRDLFAAIFSSGKISPGIIRDFLDSCASLREGNEAPHWKMEIDRVINERIIQIGVN